ncbi:hypothetical protein ACFPES_14760 [Paenibacillus sp. GCM10023248]|uniref:hypothetical protein n=1 Tax=Bacillales TaxID=1385 RepID=UPI00237914E8|nr:MULTISPECIES: hypothetical protein [Bacillales]MDD9268298.1 hypothetical protein [Paenibacillus sp. MAHUQ-63]MDR6879978.1 isopentenyl diphosphate isomerase/L-lactate dehydrogenase-like FMN-dependent dehydrogenase [Bacillus sp. 3255]
MTHFYASNKAHIFWDDVIEAVVIRWHSYAQGEDFRVPLNKMIELAVNKKAKKALSDNSHILVSAEDAKWLSEDWLPRLHEAGIQYSATVHHDQTITAIDMRNAEGEELPAWFHHEIEDIHNAVGWLSGISA